MTPRNDRLGTRASALRRTLFPLQLVARRLPAGGQRLALVAVGIVAGAAVIAAVLGGRLVMQDRALTQAESRLTPAEKTVQVAWFGAYGGTWRSLDRVVAPRIARVTGQPPARAMLYREASVAGPLVNVRAADDLARWVKLSSGRLPRTCAPARCEVVRLQGTGPVPSAPGIRLVEVGRGTLRADTPFAGFVEPASQSGNDQVARAVRYHTPQPSPVVLAEGVEATSRLPALETFFRSYGWFVPVRPGDVHPWAVDRFRRRVETVGASIVARSDRFQVTAPTEQLATAAASSHAAARRLLLLGGESGALLLAFTVLAAAALRRDAEDARRRLTWFGARRWQVELFTFAEAAVVGVVATATGWVVGAGAAAFVAARAGSPGGEVVTNALLSRSGLLTALGVAAAATLLLYATVRAPAVQLGRLAVTPLDAAALGAVAVVAVGYTRGSVDAPQLAHGGGTGSFLLLVPALVAFAASVLAARVLAPALRALGRAARRGPIALRLAAASLARNPGHAAIAATFLVASLGLALFAVAYRGTLLRGQADEAAYAVPASFVLSEDLAQLIPVLHAAPPSGYPIPPTSVLRLTGNVPSSAPFTFLGIPAITVAHVGGWRADFASFSRGELARRLASSDQSLRTTELPAGRTLTIPAWTHGDDVSLRAIFRSPLGDYESVLLGETHGARITTLHARLPFAHAALARIELGPVNSGRTTANAGTGLQPTARGTLFFGVPREDGLRLGNLFARWTGVGGVTDDGNSLSYTLTTDATGTFRPRQPTDGHALRVLVTPAIAAAAGDNGLLPIAIEGEQVQARIVGVVRRFPSIVGDAVVADRETAATVLDTRSPGLGTTDELWLDVPSARVAETELALSRSPFDPLTVQSRAATLEELRADPLARGALLTLAGTAAVALALALLGLLLATVGDVRDDRGELFDLEAQGAAPSTIRAHLRLRAALVAAFGLLGGLLLGAVLSRVVLSLVTLTASAAKPEPPLRLSLDPVLLAGAVLLYVLAAALLVGAATRLGGRAPSRAAEATA